MDGTCELHLGKKNIYKSLIISFKSAAHFEDVDFGEGLKVFVGMK